MCANVAGCMAQIDIHSVPPVLSLKKIGKEMCHCEICAPQRGKSCCYMSSSVNALLSKQYYLQILADQLFPYIDLHARSSDMLDNHRELGVK